MDTTDFRILIERVGKEAAREYVVVIGAAALIPQLDPSANALLLRTQDIDVVLDVDERTADHVHFILGEGSPFDEQYGIYAQPVDFETPACAPLHWVSRTLAVPCGSVIALCMEVHDLALSKYGAGRHKDLEFNRVLVSENLVHKEILLERLIHVECDPYLRELMRARIERDFQEAGKLNGAND